MRNGVREITPLTRGVKATKDPHAHTMLFLKDSTKELHALFASRLATAWCVCLLDCYTGSAHTLHQ